jgi:hypothetical protein
VTHLVRQSFASSVGKWRTNTWTPEDENDDEVSYIGIVFEADESRALHELWPTHGTHIDALLTVSHQGPVLPVGG